MKFNSVVAYATLAASFGHSLPTKRNVATSGDISTSDGLPAKRFIASPNVLPLIKRNAATSEAEKRNVVSLEHLTLFFAPFSQDIKANGF